MRNTKNLGWSFSLDDLTPTPSPWGGGGSAVDEMQALREQGGGVVYQESSSPFDWQSLQTAINPGPWTLTNPAGAGGSSSSDFTPENLSKWLQTGLMAYSQFREIQAGGHPFGTLPTGDPAPPPGADQLPPDPPPGFDFAQLYDFTTPYPYVIGALLLGGAWLLRSRSKRGR